MRLAPILAPIALTVATAATAQDAPPFAAFDGASLPVLNDPHDLAFGPDGRLYVADKFGHRIAVIDPETLELDEMLGEGRLPVVHDISFGPTGAAVIAVTGSDAVLVYADPAEIGATPDLAFSAPGTEGALAHSNGRIYAMAGGIGVLAAIEGTAVVHLAEGHFGAHDVAEDRAGNLWVADNAARRLVKYGPDLDLLQIIDAPKFGFLGPRYLDVTDEGYLAVADQDAHRILLIDPDGAEGGTLLGQLGSGSPGLGPNLFDDPEGIAVRGARFYISDSDNNRIVRYTVVLN
jgi:DNA-binding beta-propeller fold protein YncE